MDSKAKKQEVKSHVMKKQWLKAMKSYTTKKAEAQEKMEREFAVKRADPAYQLAEWLNGVNSLIIIVKDLSQKGRSANLQHGLT